MVRLFLRFYGVLIATLVFSFVVQMQLMDYVWRHVSSGFDFRARFQPTFHLIERTLEAHPREQWPERFRELQRGFGLEARFSTEAAAVEHPRLRPEQRAALANGHIVSLEGPGGPTLLKRVLDQDHVVALDLPAPDSRRVKLITYAANWAVEFSVVAILVWFWVRPFWRELLALRAAAEAIGAGRFEVRPAVRRGSVLRELADAFAAMARQVGCLLHSHRSLTSAVSHELRTPLARLRFSHSLAREEPSAEGKDRYLARMERDIGEIDELASELLAYARLERGTPALEMQTVPVEPWLEDVLQATALAPAGESDAVRIETRLEVETIRCEPRYMARALANLVRNAVAHARTSVLVSVRQEAGRSLICVEDDGPGIPEPDRERLFKPFERIDRSRDRDNGGFGLGLAIVRQVARWHAGEARIGDSPLGGARVCIAW